MKMVSFVTVLPDSIDYSVTWSPDNNIGALNGTETRFFGIGNYTYTVTLATPSMALDPLGCVTSDTQRVNSYPPVVLSNLTTSPITVPYGSSIQLNASGAIYYSWTPADGSLSNNDISNPIASPRDPQTIYTVYGMNLFGCIDSAQIIVNIDNNLPDGVPSAFTPNGDGNNDVFKVSGITFQKMVDFRVYNRWGQEIFRTSNPEIGWDGTYHGVPQDIGVYNWTIIVSHPNDGNKVFKGNVTLIR
jgi:gliding motility-associated-like protein